MISFAVILQEDFTTLPIVYEAEVTHGLMTMIKDILKENIAQATRTRIIRGSYWKKDAAEIALFYPLSRAIRKYAKGNVLAIISDKRILNGYTQQNRIKNYIDNLDEINSEENGFYDVIICLETFDQHKNPQEIINRIEEKLKKGGILILVAPFLMDIHQISSYYHRNSKNGIQLMLSNDDILRVVHAGGILSYIHSVFSEVAEAIIFESKALFILWERCNFALGYFIYICEKIVRLNLIPYRYIFISKKK